MEKPSIPYQPGDALINAQACFPDLERLQKEFDVLYFLDFCAGLDSLVLHNSLYTVGSLPSARSNPLITPLLENQILKFCEFRTPDPLESAQEMFRHRRGREMLSLAQATPLDGDFSTDILANVLTLIMDFVLEDSLQMPLVHSAHSLPIYLRLPDIQKEQTAMRRFYGALAEKYADFRDVLFAMKEKADGKSDIRIPPIALDALSRASNFEELGPVILELRDKYKKVRDQFAELDETMRSDDQTLKKKLKAQAKLEKSINKLFTADELDGITVFTSFARGFNESVDVEEIIDEPEISDIRWTKLLAYVLDKGEAFYWKFRLSPLHSTKKRYLNMSNNQIFSVVKRHFGHGLTETDLHAVKQYWREIEGSGLVRNVGG